jgi:RAD51-like protein 2
MAASMIDKLHAHGFRVLTDLQGVKPLDLAQELGISPSQAMSILRQAQSVESVDANGSGTSAIASNTGTNGRHPLFTPLLSSSSSTPTVISAKELVTRMSMQRPIITFCKALDTMLGGGISLGQVTEVCGVPGIGKTQLLCQLALNVQIPDIFHGQGGEALFIDTEGAFIPERVADMAQELSKHLQKLSAHHATRSNHDNNPSAEAILRAQIQAANSMTMEKFLTGIYVHRCHDISELQAFLAHLTTFLSLHPNIRVVILDSVAFPFRAAAATTTATNYPAAAGGGGVGNASTQFGGSTGGVSSSSSSLAAAASVAERQRQLAALAQRLTEVAYQHRCAVVVSNHVTTKIMHAENAHGGEEFDGRKSSAANITSTSSGTSRIIPALGEAWAHAMGTRLLLHWDQNHSFVNTSNGKIRVASLVKSPSMPLQSVPYTVNTKGIRDLPSTSSKNTASASIRNHPAVVEASVAAAAALDQIVGAKRSYSTTV